MRGDKNMGVFETIFRKPKADLKAEGYFKMLNGYTPVFSNAPESIYEMELTRAAIHSFASFASKLKPEISGTAQKNLERTLQFKPNPFMDTSKFIYRIATILSVNNTCFIVPIEDEFGIIPCFLNGAKLSSTTARRFCVIRSGAGRKPRSSLSASA